MRIDDLLYIGFLGAALFEQTNSRECACANRDVKIRSGPGFKFKKLGLLTKRTCLTYKKTAYSWHGSWALVEYNSETGWIRTNRLKINTCSSAINKCACATTNVNIRSGAGASNDKLGLLKSGACVPFKGNTIPSGSHDWAHVDYTGKDAFIASTYLTIGSCESASAVTQCACGTGNVNIRSGASTSNPILGVLKIGACVPYKGKQIPVGNTKWAQVDYNGQNGFVSARYLSIRSCSELSVINQCACGTTDVNIRSGASTSNSKIGLLQKETCLPYKGDQIPVGTSRWAHVDFKGKEAYISSRYLTFEPCGGSNGNQCACGTTRVNIRSGAGTTNDVIGSLTSGSCVPYKGSELFVGNLRWVNVDYKGTDGYVASKYVVFKSCE